MASKLSLQVLFLLLVSIAPHVILARELHSHSHSHSHGHKSYPRLFPQHLEGSGKGDNVEGIYNVKLYLQRYGHLANDNVETNDNAFDDALESAIKKYQKYFKLNVSGTLDRQTLVLMSQPRCGVTDAFFTMANGNGKLEVNGSHYAFLRSHRKWPASKHSLTYAFINNYPQRFIAPVVRAFDDWDFNTLFSFTQASRVQAADIVLSFERGAHGDRFPFDGREGVLAHAFGPGDGRVHFDADENWVVGRVDGAFDVQTIALHELGHVLGLGHSSDQEAIMWPYMDPGVTKELDADDIEGIRALYFS